jgi:hypothetical protein
MALDPKNELSVRRWRAAGRMTLAILLAFSALQYYFFDVQLQILAMPGLIVVTPSAARTPCSAGTRDQSAVPGTPLPCG